MRSLQAFAATCVLAVGLLASAVPAQGASNISFGITVGTALPKEAASLRVGKDTFYVYHGSFYRQVRVGYVLVPPPHGATIRNLPRGAEKFTIGKVVYFRQGGIYFKADGGRFQVCDAPAGAPNVEPVDVGTGGVAVSLEDDQYVFTRGRFFRKSPEGWVGRGAPLGAVAKDFPPDAMSVWFRNSEYYEANGVFFQEIAGGFKVVPPPWQSTLSPAPETTTLASQDVEPALPRN